MQNKSKKFSKKMLNQLSWFLLKWQRLSWAYPKTVLSIFSFLVVIIFPWATKLQFLVSAEDLLDPSAASRVHLDQLRTDFEAGESIYVVFKPKTPWLDSSFCQVRRWISEQVLNNDDLQGIRSPFESRKATLLRNPENNLQRFFPPLLNLECEKMKLQNLTRSPWGSFFVSHTEDDLGVDLFFPKDHSNQFQTGFDPLRVQRLKNSIPLSFSEKIDSWEIHWSGLAYFQDYVFKALQIKNLLNLILIFGFLIFFRLILGTWISGLIYASTVILTCGLVFGLMASLGHFIDVLSSSIFPMILVSALEDYLFLCLLFYKDPSRYQKHFRKLLIPSFFTSASTAMGFGSLCVSGLRGVDRFGLWAAVASCIEWSVVFLILPSLISLFQSMFRQKMNWIHPDKVILPILSKDWFCWRSSKRLTMALLLLMFIAPFSVFTLKVVDSPSRTFSSHHPYNQDLNYIKQTRGWEGQLDLVFTDSSEENANQAVLKELSKILTVRALLSPYDIRSFVIQDLPEYAKNSTLKDLENSRAYQQYFSTKGTAKAQLFLNSTSTDDLRPLFSRIQELCKGGKCYPAGEIESFFEMNEKVLEVLLESLLVSVGLVLLILFFLTNALSNLKGFIFLSISSLWGPTVMILFMSFTHISVTYVTCIFASVLVGLTGDNAIQFLFASRHKSFSHNSFQKGIHELGSSSITLALAMSGSCLLFLISPFESEKNLGWLFSFGFILCAVGDIWLLQGLEQLWPNKASK